MNKLKEKVLKEFLDILKSEEVDYIRVVDKASTFILKVIDEVVDNCRKQFDKNIDGFVEWLENENKKYVKRVNDAGYKNTSGLMDTRISVTLDLVKQYKKKVSNCKDWEEQ